MAEVCGKEVLSRPGVTKVRLQFPLFPVVSGSIWKTHADQRLSLLQAMWVYIKANNLQDPNKKTDILPDETLKRVLPFDRINAFTMAKHVRYATKLSLLLVLRSVPVLTPCAFSLDCLHGTALISTLSIPRNTDISSTRM
jgi:hypothetical protein